MEVLAGGYWTPSNRLEVHKNLSYLQSAKRLNPQQYRWSLFFSRYNLNISLYSQSKNKKPDGLYRIHHSSDTPTKDTTFLSPSCFIGSLTWDIKQSIKNAQQTEPEPGGGPQGRLYVPSSLWAWTIHWGHSSRFSCHPWIGITIALLLRYFWWPSLNKNVAEYNSACRISSQNKSSPQPPAGHLQPLSIPTHPWSHISMDFITGLPPSKGKTVILSIIYRFYKACNFIALSKLPSSAETAVSSSAILQSSNFMESSQKLSSTKDLNSPLPFGSSYVILWVLSPAYLPVFIPKLMVSVNA